MIESDKDDLAKFYGNNLIPELDKESLVKYLSKNTNKEWKVGDLPKGLTPEQAVRIIKNMEVYNPHNIDRIIFEATIEEMKEWTANLTKYLKAAKAVRLYYKAIETGRLELAKRLKAKYMTKEYSPYNNDRAVAFAMAIKASNNGSSK